IPVWRIQLLQTDQKAGDEPLLQRLVSHLGQRTAHRRDTLLPDAQSEFAQKCLLLLRKGLLPALALRLDRRPRLTDAVHSEFFRLGLNARQLSLPLSLEATQQRAVSLPLRNCLGAQAPRLLCLCADARLPLFHRPRDRTVQEAVKQPDQERKVDELRENDEPVDQQGLTS